MVTLTKLEEEHKKTIIGKSGNKGGRPKGAKNKTTILKEIIDNNVMAQFANAADGAAKRLIEGVMEGDSTCTKIFWDRILPSQKAVDGSTPSAPTININVTGMEHAPQAIVIENEVEQDD